MVRPVKRSVLRFLRNGLLAIGPSAWRHTRTLSSVGTTSRGARYLQRRGRPFGDGFAGVFRSNGNRLPHRQQVERRRPRLASNPSRWRSLPVIPAASDYAYDPRVTKIDQTYYVTCGGLLRPDDQHRRDEGLPLSDPENAFLPFNCNGVLFLRKIGGKYVMPAAPATTATPVRRYLHQPKPPICATGACTALRMPRRRPGRPMVATHQNWADPCPSKSKMAGCSSITA